MASPNEPVVIVGAGLAGLVAAAEVASRGRPVVVVDRSPAVGGRLATVSVSAGSSDEPSAVADLGAQFFTVRSEPFRRFVDGLVAKDVVYEWCRGFNSEDGYPRYAARGGMSALASHLAEELPRPTADVRTAHLAEAVGPTGGGSGGGGARPGRWRVVGPGWEQFAHAVLLTCPVPESLELLRADGGAALAPVDPALLKGLEAIDYHRVLAVAAVLDRPSAIPPPGARQLEEGPFSFVADNAAKGVSAVPVVTLHAAHATSAQRWEDDDASLLATLLEEARPWLGTARVVHAHLERWRWSGPVVPWPDRCCELTPGLLLAGDAFGGPKVEGAYLSGLEAGRQLAEMP